MLRFFICVSGAMFVAVIWMPEWLKNPASTSYALPLIVLLLCILLASTLKKTEKKYSFLEYVGMITPFDLMLTGISLLTMCGVWLLSPGLFIFLMSVIGVGAGVSILIFFLKKYTL